MSQLRLPGAQGSLWEHELLEVGRELGAWGLGCPSLRHQGPRDQREGSGGRVPN